MTSALPLRADLAQQTRHVRFVPGGASCTAAKLFDHLVSADKNRGRYGEAERFGSLHVDQEFELGRLFNRQIGRLGAFENFINVAACTAEQIDYIGAVDDQS